jgi:hypothetical protein
VGFRRQELLVIALYVLGFVWALPLTLFGLLLVPWYWPKDIKWDKAHRVLLIQVKDIKLKFGQHPTGQTFGVVVLVTHDFNVLNPVLVVHEAEHVYQGFLWGILFGPAYGIACIIAAAKGGHFYRDNWFEIKARAAAAASLKPPV